MDPKELKTLLKEAKSALKAKDFLTAAKNCKLVLKKVPDNYQANLHLGTSMMEQSKWQQAIESYKRATEIDPVQPYAWQGVILTYERQGVKTHPDLLDAYNRVSTFLEQDEDKSKYIESRKKMANLLISQGDGRGALKIISKLATGYGMDLEIAMMVENLLAGTKFETRSQDQNQLYTQALRTTVTMSPQPKEDTCKKYFTQLNRCSNYDEVINQAVSMKEKWNFYSSPMEWLCRYYIEDRLNEATILKTGTLDTVTDKLFKLYPSSTFGHFARGKFLIDEGLNMNDGFAFIKTGLESSYNLFAVQTLIRGRLDFGDFEGALEDGQRGLREFSRFPDIVRQMKLFCAEAWIWLEQQKAEELLENVKDDVKESPSHYDQWVILNIKLYGKKMAVPNLQKYLSLAEEKGLTHWTICFYKSLIGVDLNDPKQLEIALDSIKKTALPDEKNNFHLLLENSVVLFDHKCYKEAADLFVAITNTEVGRKRPLPWKYLGQLYTLQDDLEMASKCLKKSYKLCPSADVGALLSDNYFQLGKEDLNQDLLVGATKSFIKSKSKWAWLRLGILNLHRGEANDAVTALQAAIRADINDKHVWESLADAYFSRGSYSAALNAYNKALSLGTDPLYSKLRIGVVYQCLGQHDDSVETLKNLLDETSSAFTPVLVELARTHSLIAQELIQENFDIRAQAAVESSLAYAVLAISNSTENILLPWTIIGESALTLNSIPKGVNVKVPTILMGENTEGISTGVKKVDELEYASVSLEKLREIGIHALLECLRRVDIVDIKKQKIPLSANFKGYIFHQLSMLYFHRARHFAALEDLKVSSDLFKKALIAAKKAIVLNQSQYIFWNTLGVIAYFMENDELAQHSFIKSLQIEGSNVVSWCNLGMLYLKRNEHMLAHKVFFKGQSVSPLHPWSWIGQGLVAEKIQPDEAADLFRHATHLEPSSFGVSCYADWICRILLKEIQVDKGDYWFCIQRVDALTIVNDLITRVEARNCSPYLYNMKGIIAGLNGFYETALESFTQALTLATNNPSFPLSPENLQQILLNKIVILVKLQKYEEAVEAFSSIEHLDQIGFAVGALTMSKLGYLEQSEKLYGQLLHCFTDSNNNDTDRINVTIALGLVRNLKDGPEAACNLLLQDFMAKSPHGLLALSAIGILNGDSDFVSNVMQHLEPFEGDIDVLPDIGLLKACFQIMNGESRKAVVGLLKLVHSHPENTRLWSILAQIVFRHEFQSIHSSTFQKITESALKLSRLNSKETTAQIYYKSSAMISLCNLMNDDWKTAVTTALKGIKKYPAERENWVVLACAFWYQFTETREASVYRKVIKLLEKELRLNRINRRAEEWVQQFLQLANSYAPS